MTVELIVLAIALAAFSGVPGLLGPPGSRFGELTSVVLLGLAAILGISVGVWVLMTGERLLLEVPWSLPGARLALRVDALSGFFLLPIFGVSFLGALYGLEYWKESAQLDSGRPLRFVYGLVVAGLSTVAVAADGILFLFGWEVMALAAFVAVATEHRLEPARQAGYLYLVTTRVGTLALFAMFALIHSETGSFALAPLPTGSTARLSAIFLLGLFGFGVKAGVMPLHVWLPPAHAAAPSHVSAMMSGVLIKIGIYGLFRLLSLFSSPPMWWALVLLGLGALSAVLGVAFAIGQHDLKRLLAYHSIENIGIIVLGLGVGLLGRVLGRPELVALGFGGALLHTWNHGLFKSLLFLSAGAVVHSTHTRQIDRLGGLYRRMPWAGSLFLLAAVAISGLPPLNGFVSELLVYLGLFQGVGASDGRAWVGAAMSLGALTLTGGLALACFAKVFGAVFLGQARSNDAAKAHDGGPLMTGSMLVLATACVVLGVFPLIAQGPLDRAIAAVFSSPQVPSVAVVAPLAALTGTAGALLALILLSGLLFQRRVSRSSVAAGPTWDCGYAAPSARMQYTASSFAELLVGLFSWALRPTSHGKQLTELLPGPGRFESHVDDAILEKVGRPATKGVVEILRWFHFFQPGRLNLYVLYVVATVIALLLWAQGATR